MRRRAANIEPWPEIAVDLQLWMADGQIASGNPRKDRQVPELEVGRTDSQRRLGFSMRQRDSHVPLFALDRAQVENLIPYLKRQLRRLKPPRTDARAYRAWQLDVLAEQEERETLDYGGPLEEWNAHARRVQKKFARARKRLKKGAQR